MLTAKELATIIVDDLFTSGAGTKASRLILRRDSDGVNLGVYSEGPMIDRVEMLLQKHGYVDDLSVIRARLAAVEAAQANIREHG